MNQSKKSRPSPAQQNALKRIPGVDKLLDAAKNRTGLSETPRSVLLDSIHSAITAARETILACSSPGAIPEGFPSFDDIMAMVEEIAYKKMQDNLKVVINATGVVIHTNLGRSILAKQAIDHINRTASWYSNLEYNLETGKRGLRYAVVEDLLCEISGAEAAMVVNNNAAAVLLCLDTIAKNKEVIVSRGELVEIGGSFRIPDVMAKSGARLREVGTTNRTHIHDFQSAICEETGLLLKVHTSNYAIVGFTSSVSLPEMVDLGRRFGIPVMEDLGSGMFIDFSRYGLVREPTVQDSIASGADIVTFSGDKLLGGPQAGIILGSRNIINMIRKNPLTRAMRIDKMTLAGLEATLKLYRDPQRAVTEIPTLRLILETIDEIKKRARKIARKIQKAAHDSTKILLLESRSKTGGGALPLLDLPTVCIGLKVQGVTASRIEQAMRCADPPVIGRIENDIYMLDARTVLPDQIETLANTVTRVINERVAS